MAIGAIGFFGRGDLMRQRMHWNAQRYSIALSDFAARSGIDVGQMPGSVLAEPTEATQAVSGYGSFDGYGRVTSGQILSAVAGGPIGLALNNKSLAHAKKMCRAYKSKYAKLVAKNKSDKRIAKIKAKYEHWCAVATHHAQVKAAKKMAITKDQKRAARGMAKDYRHWKKDEKHEFKALKKDIRHGRLPTAAKAAAITGLVNNSTQGSMTPPGAYDYLQARPLARTMGRRPASEMVDDASAMAAASGADLDPTASMDAEDAATLAEHEEDGGEGIMAKLSSMPTWGWVAIVGGVGALFFFRSANGRRFLQRITKRKGGHGPSTTGAAAAK